MALRPTSANPNCATRCLKKVWPVMSRSILRHRLARVVGKRVRQRQVWVFGLLGEFMMLEMIGAIGDQVRSDRGARQPLAKEIVEFAVQMQRAVRGIVHQDGEPELAPADKDDGEQPQGGVLRPGGDADERDADDPCVGDEPDAAP